MRSGESSIEQRPDTRICVVQRISDGMKECEGDGCQRKSAAVEKECRTSGGQTNMTDHRCLQILVFHTFEHVHTQHKNDCTLQTNLNVNRRNDKIGLSKLQASLQTLFPEHFWLIVVRKRMLYVIRSPSPFSLFPLSNRILSGLPS